MNYCTLFDSNYIDKGIVMLESLFNVDKNAKIYVLCMDERTKKILDDLSYNELVTIALDEFENEELLRVKQKRSKGEYCWTCTGKLIQYIIKTYSLEVCAYVDSDLCFYSDPNILIDEMNDSDCEVLVVPHRFPPTFSGRLQEKNSGRICVQFNVFRNTPKSLALLNEWNRQCIEECSVNSAGDQKYTDPWYEIPYVKVSNNCGAGIAPWNLTRYKMIKDTEFVIDRYDKSKHQIVFYHFQNITYLERLKARVMPKAQYWYIDNNLFDFFYIDYLVKIERVKQILEEKYNFVPSISTYIATREKDRKTFKDRILQIFKEPISVTCIKINSVIKMFLRKKQTIIDISKYIRR